MARLQEIVLAMTRAAATARAEGDVESANRINRGLAAMLALDTDDTDDNATNATRLGGFEVR
jgi:hypothetical protein